MRKVVKGVKDVQFLYPVKLQAKLTAKCPRNFCLDCR